MREIHMVNSLTLRGTQFAYQENASFVLGQSISTTPHMTSDVIATL